MSNQIQLNQEQQDCINQFKEYLLSPFKPENDYLVISGAAGTGKSTILKYMVETIKQLNDVNKIINLTEIPYKVTATTNKAVEILKADHNAITVHDHLNLFVAERHNRTVLYQNKANTDKNIVVFVDECSYIDSSLMNFIKDCSYIKWVFIGDEAQLPPVGEAISPVFSSGFPMIRLHQIMRQADDNQIQDYSRKLREYIIHKQEFPKLNLGKDIQLVSKKEFEKLITNVGNNDCVLAYTNLALSRLASFVSPSNRDKLYTPSVGDYVEVISKFAKSFKCFIREVDNDTFSSRHLSKRLFTTNWKVFNESNNTSLNFLRPALLNTIHKAQGSTYDTVYIYLPDLNRCTDMDLKIRLLYVAISRARYKVILTGDLSCPS